MKTKKKGRQRKKERKKERQKKKTKSTRYERTVLYVQETRSNQQTKRFNLETFN